ncbi:leucine-rich repeat domain-containing protein [Paenibacillus planticolens]|uniref:Internalin-A n=1 Tax=Paenibacillus planticolens TaxID=2654976 RepID=A0ABX1ZJQ6_9BACL|nr:leucine-rich repeat domain-containing protein [Paenibacillus planticolens]NOV00056.1 hypothetical protein [Paenibacillus planticolens]
MKEWKSMCCLLLCILMIGIMSPVSASEETVSFTDANLEAAVRDALNKPAGAITAEEIKGLTQLQASGRGIIDVSGIEYAVNLKSLNLSNNAIQDISRLRSLSKLETLIINGNQIAAVDALGSLTLLKSLWLMNNQISDVSAIGSLKQLEHLYLANNQISSLMGLGTLLQLQELNLALNRIKDISPIKTLSMLQSLNLEGNQISDISGLDRLGQLQWLSLAYNPVSNLTPLGGLTQLNYINQRGYPVSDSSKQILHQLENRGGIAEYALVIPAGAYVYDVNQDGITDANDINDMINYYLNVNNMKTKHPELKIAGNVIDPALLNKTSYIYDINRDGVADTNDINDAINFYLNLKDMKNKHPEFIVVAN